MQYLKRLSLWCFLIIFTILGLSACASIATQNNSYTVIKKVDAEQGDLQEESLGVSEQFNESDNRTSQTFTITQAPTSFNLSLYNQQAATQLGSLTANFKDWEFQNFPGKKQTRYELAQAKQINLIKATANGSASMLRKRLALDPKNYQSVKMAWKVVEKAKNAQVTQAHLDDSSMRLVLAFDGDKNKWAAKDAVLSELSELLTGEPMPYATLMYVLCDECPFEAVIHNQKTSRIRYLVVGKATGFEGKWQFLKRNIHEDFVKSFQESPGELVSLGIMTDGDNSKASTSTWYGPVVLE